MSKQPLVSVVMATYNEEPEIIKKSIKSIQDQTYRNFELLIFDDSTNLDTRNAIDAFTEDESIQINGTSMVIAPRSKTRCATIFTISCFLLLFMLSLLSRSLSCSFPYAC